MQNIMKRTAAGALIGGSLLFTGMGVAQAAPPQNQDGLVNVAVGDVTILDQVGIGVAANVAAAICGLDVPVNVLGEQVRAGQDVTVCTIDRQAGSVPITITG
jgi:hypothetical protein